MKNIFTFLCIFITAAANAQTTFKTNINTGGDNYIFEVIQISDGSYIGIGARNINEDDRDILLVKLNPQGGLLSSITIGTSGYDEGISIIKTSDGGFAVSGTMNNKLGILKFDASLNLLWKKIYPRLSESYGIRIIQTVEGGFIVIGKAYDDDSFGNTGYLVKTDNLGNLLLARQYFGFSSNDNSITDIAATSDGNYVILAQVSSYDFANDESHDTTYLAKINPTGNILWSKYIETGANSNYSVSLLQASDGGLVIAGAVNKLVNYMGSPTELTQMLMTKFNAAGTLLWSKSISTSNISTSRAYSVVEDNDGGYIFSGGISDLDNTPGDTTSGYIVKLSSGGTLQWTKTIDKYLYSTDYLSTFASIIHTTDGGYAASGFILNESGGEFISNGIIYKFDNNFNICGYVGSNGSIANKGSGISKNIAVYNITPAAANINLTLKSAGTALNNCNAVVNTYTFNGNGNWSVAANWSNSTIPPSPLPQNSQIIINPAGNGECILNVPFTIPQGNKITVQTGKKFRLLGNLTIK
ncbi:MAG: hypothetical protein ABIN97_17680 [Ginsengibacter sp.]